MKIIIPAKVSSIRVANKNWRPFYEGKSLVEITVDKLKMSGVAASDIFVSCEDLEKRNLVEAWGCRFLPRSRRFCENDCPITNWIRNTFFQLDESEVGWAQVCDPFFDDYGKCFELWKSSRGKFDSLCCVYPKKEYLLDSSKSPIGWQFGEYHTPSQSLPTFYRFPFTFSILTSGSVARTGYHIGTAPYWFECESRGIDIDTERDFELASILYPHIMGCK